MASTPFFSHPHSTTCTMTLTTWRPNLPSQELGHPDPRASCSSNASMNWRTPWRKKWRAPPRTASASRRKRTPAIWERPPAPDFLPTDELTQRPPVSKPTTIKWHRWLWTNSAYFRSLSPRGLWRATQSVRAAPCVAIPSVLRTHRKVMSTASWQWQQ